MQVCVCVTQTGEPESAELASPSLLLRNKNTNMLMVVEAEKVGRAWRSRQGRDYVMSGSKHSWKQWEKSVKAAIHSKTVEI